ncbi:uncharacterized protein G2W53_016930 [Senna tora]|uniref:Uncharacterized protein n=1 Tax=Senna tora TaxID=362788 RepID=A0A834TRV0_9FABA|nr:uncharacterized protein G2W53_016930 [Senna tora]
MVENTLKSGLHSQVFFIIVTIPNNIIWLAT